MDESTQAAVWVTGGLILCALLGAGPGYAVMALNATTRWKRRVFTIIGLAMLPGLMLCAWSLTLAPESIGWGFLLSGSSLVLWPWIAALVLALWHFLLVRKNTQ
ncbi:hypothetical protein [Polaromonas aquatica]|uniref:hypothetical protein n=1 Tax=Polaromonas aquatica TaxID=332657 RepID=UPI003D65D4B1